MVALVLSDFVDWHDPRLVELGGRLSFRMQPLDIRWGSKLPTEDHLHGDQPIQRQLPGLGDHSHPATGDLLKQLVIAEITYPDEGGSGGGRGAPKYLQRLRELCHPVMVGEKLAQTV